MSEEMEIDFCRKMEAVDLDPDTWRVWEKVILLGEGCTIEPSAFLEALGRAETDPAFWLMEKLDQLCFVWMRIKHGQNYSFLPMIEAYTWDSKNRKFLIKLSPMIFSVLDNYGMLS